MTALPRQTPFALPVRLLVLGSVLLLFACYVLKIAKASSTEEKKLIAPDITSTPEPLLFPSIANIEYSSAMQSLKANRPIRATSLAPSSFSEPEELWNKIHKQLSEIVAWQVEITLLPAEPVMNSPKSGGVRPDFMGSKKAAPATIKTETAPLYISGSKSGAIILPDNEGLPQTGTIHMMGSKSAAPMIPSQPRESNLQIDWNKSFQDLLKEFLAYGTLAENQPDTFGGSKSYVIMRYPFSEFLEVRQPPPLSAGGISTVKDAYLVNNLKYYPLGEGPADPSSIDSPIDTFKMSLMNSTNKELNNIKKSFGLNSVLSLEYEP